MHKHLSTVEEGLGLFCSPWVDKWRSWGRLFVSWSWDHNRTMIRAQQQISNSKRKEAAAVIVQSQTRAVHKHTPANLNELNQCCKDVWQALKFIQKTITAAHRFYERHEKQDCTCYDVNMNSEKIWKICKETRTRNRRAETHERTWSNGNVKMTSWRRPKCLCISRLVKTWHHRLIWHQTVMWEVWRGAESFSDLLTAQRRPKRAERLQTWCLGSRAAG